ncbi:MAG TPA: lysophospholipid acyltransferase family protein [Methylophilaceae bacterium]|nr:lysophospholipid acyltransferase family protein [Methylophilaceae bacterium]
MANFILIIRAFLFYLGMFIITPLFALLVILMFPLNNITRSRMASYWAHCSLAWLKLTCNLSFTVRGRENIPDHPSIILCKHQSAWETIALQVIFPPQIWVLKRELLFIPFMGWAWIAMSAIPINRAGGREALKQLVKHGKDRLARGLWVVIFPEGTRVAPGVRGKYHIGGAWLASHTQSTVVPVAHNAGLFWRKNAFIKQAGTITVSIGKPIETAGMKADEVNKRAEEWIENEMLVLPQRAE